MKKITFLLFTLITTTFLGQDKLTSSLSEYYNGTDWVNSNRTDFEYDSNKNLTKEVEFYWDSSTSTWIKSSESTYTYPNNNKVFLEYYNSYSGGSLTQENRTANYYDTNGNLYQIKDWENNGGNWIVQYVFDIAYVNGKISSAISKEWDGALAEYFYGDDSSNITLTYNANGKVSISKSDSWEVDEWVTSDRTVYTYDANDRITVEDGQTWDGANWVTDYKSEYTYDTNGNAVIEKDSYLDDNVLIEGDEETITFDTSKLMSNYAHPFRDKTGIDFIFSADGIFNKILQRSSTNYRTTYNYNEATAGTRDFSLVNFAIYPNPATSVLHIDNSNFTIKNVEVYNVLGKKIITSNKNQLNIENLVNGVYVLKIQDDKGNMATKRFVKK